MSDQKRLPRGLQGDQGVQGVQGVQGERGLSPAALRGLAVLLVLMLAVGALNLLFTAHYVNATRAAQQQQGQMFEHAICTTLEKLAREKPPPGNPATNPSRAYLQNQHATLAELGPDLGCKVEGQ